MLLSTGSWVENHPAVGLLVLLLIWALAALKYSLAFPLWHDEIFTFFIAQAPGLHDLFHLTANIDLNPPLSYLLTRASFDLFGVGTLQCRLPEILGFALAIVGIFLFVRRRTGNAYGLLAAALLLSGIPGDLSIQARPYGLMLGLIALALVAWQASSSAAVRSYRSILANVLLFVALAALLLTHVFGLLAWAAIAAGELVQSVERRRLEPARIIAFLLPLAAIAFYLPLLQNHGTSAFPPAFQASPNDVFEFYILHIARELICIWLSALTILLLAGRSWLRGSPGFFLTRSEWIVTCGLIAIPFVIIFRLMALHAAFFDRYGTAGSLGIFILFAIFFCWWSGSRPASAVVATLIALLISSRIPDAITAAATGQIFRHTEPAVTLITPGALTDPSLPLVDASGLTFLEMNRREPSQLLDHTYYLVGGPAAIQYAHASIFEGMALEAKLFHLRGQVEPYSQFLQEHPHFYVFGTYEYPEDWLLRKLQADGANLRRLGDVDTSYKNNELYEVTMPTTKAKP